MQDFCLRKDGHFCLFAIGLHSLLGQNQDFSQKLFQGIRRLIATIELLRLLDEDQNFKRMPEIRLVFGLNVMNKKSLRPILARF